MTIESRELFDLCKQVYEATGWPQELNISQLYEYWDDHDELCVISIEDSDDELVPSYTSDYLLEKLPEHVNRGVLVLTNGERPHAGYAQNDQYGYPSLSRGFYERAEYSDTPLKALLKLVLKLDEEELL